MYIVAFVGDLCVPPGVQIHPKNVICDVMGRALLVRSLGERPNQSSAGQNTKTIATRAL